jgi:hypothetical protein
MRARLAGLDATVDSLLPQWPPLSESDRATVSSHCVAFVRRQVSLAPAHIRLGIWILFAAFVAFAAARLTKADAPALAKFSSSGPGAFAGLERVLRSMTLLAFLEHPTVLSAIDAEDGTKR